MPHQHGRHLGFATALVVAASFPGLAGAQEPVTDPAIAAVVRTFHDALGRGDSAAVLALLAPDVVVFESGDVETRAEYRAHHLQADIEFARSVRTLRGPLRVVQEGTAAWASGTSEVTGRFKGQRVDSQGAELIVLSRGAERWRIRAIHWSSHPKGR